MLFMVNYAVIILLPERERVNCSNLLNTDCMKYLLLLILFCSVGRTAECQERSALMDMVNAEKSFAAYAGAEGITDAFMKFLLDSAKVFEGGKY